jgi:hypothetical protein
MACCVFFSWICPEILAFFTHLFSSNDLHCVFRYSFKFFCAFRILEYLLGYFLEIVCMKILLSVCWVDIDISGSFGLRSLLLQYLGIQLTAIIIPLSFLD